MTDAVVTLAQRRELQIAHERERTAHLADRDALLTPRRSNDELRALAEAAQARLADTDTATVLAWVAEEFGYRTAVACSMADAVLPAVVAEHLPWVDTLFLETGYHFAETIGTRDAVESSMKLSIVDVTPRLSVAEQDAEFGANLYERDPALCCEMRKVEPLHSHAAGLRGLDHRRAARRGPHPGQHPVHHLGREERPGQDQPARCVDLRRPARLRR